MSGFQTNLLTGIAAALQTAGLGTWSAAGVYKASETGIVLRTMPQGPDRIICLSTYGVGDDPSLSDSIIGLQIRTRWEGAIPTPVDDLDDAIFTFLHGKETWTVGSGAAAVRIGLCLRNSGPVSLGQDTNLRWSLASNYYLDLWRPSTNRA